ncbi:MAG: alpha-ketoacid dehydrogenase subunit beta [Spirochaetota bacterium]
MKAINMVQALTSALDHALEADEKVVVYGEDVGVEGGVFRVTQGLQQKYGADRVFDSPLAESAIAGTAVGMAAAGLRPVVEMQFSGFSYPAFNQIISHISRMRNRTRGRYPMPVVVRMPYGGGINAIEHHSESMEAIYAHIPGLMVVIPSSPHDAKGLLMSAVESNDPVIFMEPKRIYRAVKQEVSEEPFRIPLGSARVVQPGEHITVVAYGATIREVQKAMVPAKQAGISVELVDLRTIYPVDRETIGRSIRKTGRMLFVGEAPSSYGPGAELMSVAVEEAFLHLEAPPRRLTGFDTIVPLPQGEHFYMQDPQRIFYEIQNLVHF